MLLANDSLTRELDQLYELKSGDNLANLAYEYLGNVANFRELADLNEIDIFEKLPVGQLIKIPTIEEAEQLIKQKAGELLTSAASDLLKDLDLSPMKEANPFGAEPWQLIEWVL